MGPGLRGDDGSSGMHRCCLNTGEWRAPGGQLPAAATGLCPGRKDRHGQVQGAGRRPGCHPARSLAVSCRPRRPPRWMLANLTRTLVGPSGWPPPPDRGAHDGRPDRGEGPVRRVREAASASAAPPHPLPSGPSRRVALGGTLTRDPPEWTSSVLRHSRGRSYVRVLDCGTAHCSAAGRGWNRVPRPQQRWARGVQRPPRGGTCPARQVGLDKQLEG